MQEHPARASSGLGWKVAAVLFLLLLVALGVLVSSSFKPAAAVAVPPPVSGAANAARISIGGDVKSPQLLPFADDLTMLRAINAAGGFTEYADQSKVRLLRDGKVQIIDVKAIRKDPLLDVPLKAGDTIEVPQSFW